MNPERWEKITGIFHDALAKDAGTRETFLVAVCGTDADLRREVDALLAADANASSSAEPLRARSASVAPGTQLGPYKIESLIGAGGMGEVYKARDTRLNRSVAVKVLLAAFTSEPELRQRFEREAQAIASLHHPHICVLHDVGHQDGFEFLVMEHLIGETLQDRLAKGALALDVALRYAIEIADALHSAHRAGILHRDLKPGNIMLTKDGAKLLDFGLAKFGARSRVFENVTAMPTTPRTLTAEGTIVGTFQYMAPEQLEGKDADERTDLFAFGAVVYEMVTGRVAFSGDSRSNLIAAILRDEPPPLSAAAPMTPRVLDLVVRACLAKDPEARLQSAGDAALQLRWIQSGTLTSGTITPKLRPGRWFAWTAAAILIVSGLAAAAGFVSGQRGAARNPPTLTQLTFRQGFLSNSRFTPDGQSVVFSGTSDGDTPQVFSMRLDSREAQPLPVPAGVVLSVSRDGVLAMLTRVSGEIGTLAQVPLGGGGVREVLERIAGADWMPDGKSLAVLRAGTPNRWALEFPAGTVVQEWTAPDLPCECIRVSPAGDVVAVLELGPSGSGWISLIDRTGKKTRVSRRWFVREGITWSPSGDEVWFNASDLGLNFQVHAVTRDGRERLVHQSMGSLRVQDAVPGRALMVHDRVRRRIVGLGPGAKDERDLSWFDFGGIGSLSADGRLLSFTESGVGAGANPVGFVRNTDGSPAIRMGVGGAGAMSPDGKHVLFLEFGTGALKVLAVGAGESRTLDSGSVKFLGAGGTWLDSDRIVLSGRAENGARGTYVLSLAGGAPRLITPPVVWLGGWPPVVTPDARYVLSRERGAFWQIPIDGGERRALKGVSADETPLRFNEDGRSLWLLGAGRSPATIYRLDMATGQRTVGHVLKMDPAGLMTDWFKVTISADGKSYVYGYRQDFSDLYLAEGIR